MRSWRPLRKPPRARVLRGNEPRCPPVRRYALRDAALAALDDRGVWEVGESVRSDACCELEEGLGVSGRRPRAGSLGEQRSARSRRRPVGERVLIDIGGERAARVREVRQPVRSHARGERESPGLGG